MSLTGDSLRDYAMYSIFHAAGSKGGAGNVFTYPMQLLWNTLRFLLARQSLELVLYLLGTAGLWALLILPSLRTRRPSDFWKLVLGLIFILLPLHHFYRRGALHDQNLLIDLSALGVFLLYGLGLAVFVRSLCWRFASRKIQDWNRREILLLIPLGQLASGSMSSGGGHVGLYGPIAIMILLLPICSPVRLKLGMG